MSRSAVYIIASSSSQQQEQQKQKSKTGVFNMRGEAQRLAVREQMAAILGTNKARRTGNPGGRTGVCSKPFKQLQEESYICKSLKFTGNVGTYIFVVSRTRGFKEYVKVNDHDNKRVEFTKYGKSLLDSCFKNW